MNKTLHKAIFIDKDGTLIPDIPYNVDPALVTLEDELVEGIQKLREDGYLLIIVSNQSGVAKGLFKEEDLQGIRQRITDLLNEQGLSLEGFYYCPHEPGAAVSEYDMQCSCRKPLPGLLLQAADELQVDLSRSWMIGDILNDVEAGNRAGCKTILINNGNETEWKTAKNRMPHSIAQTINEAASIILSVQPHTSH